MTVDGFSLGVSRDRGRTFQKVMSFTDLKGPLTCPAVQTACAPHWARIQGVLGLTPFDAGTGGAPSAGNPGGGGSHCASAGAGTAAGVALLAFLVRRRGKLRPAPR
jgi:hypothetical protein